MTIILDTLALLLLGVGIGIIVLVILNWLDKTHKDTKDNDYYHRL